MPIVWNFAVGVLFGIGLSIAGMLDPAKVLNFLDVAGSWDASLAFVMAGAIAVTAPSYYYLRRRERPLFDAQSRWPSGNDIDAPLVVGAALFGVGWGLYGLCPGPAIASLAFGTPQVALFCFALLIGLWVSGKIK